MLDRLLCAVVGYLFGSFLTAELVARRCAGKSAHDLGSGNPGMANIMSTLGKRAGLAVLAGDAAKTLLACGTAWLLVGGSLGRTALLYAGVGAILGHNWPVWNGFCGGKGVTVTCVWLMVYLGGWGVLCCALGGALVLLVGYLPLGAVVIPAVGLPFAVWRCGPEGGLCVLLSAIIMAGRHRRGLMRIARGEEIRFFRKKNAASGRKNPKKPLDTK